MPHLKGKDNSDALVTFLIDGGTCGGDSSLLVAVEGSIINGAASYIGK